MNETDQENVSDVSDYEINGKVTDELRIVHGKISNDSDSDGPLEIDDSASTETNQEATNVFCEQMLSEIAQVNDVSILKSIPSDKTDIDTVDPHNTVRIRSTSLGMSAGGFRDNPGTDVQSSVGVGEGVSLPRCG